MLKSLVQSWRRPIALMALSCLMILVFALAACGGGGDNGGGNGSGGGASAQTVTVKETKGNGGADQYICDPTTITVNKGDTVTFTNTSDEKQDFDKGDAQKAGVDFVMDLNQSTKVTFKTAGTFNLQSEKGATITVTVK